MEPFLKRIVNRRLSRQQAKLDKKSNLGIPFPGIGNNDNINEADKGPYGDISHDASLRDRESPRLVDRFLDQNGQTGAGDRFQNQEDNQGPQSYPQIERVTMSNEQSSLMHDSRQISDFSRVPSIHTEVRNLKQKDHQSVSCESITLPPAVNEKYKFFVPIPAINGYNSQSTAQNIKKYAHEPKPPATPKQPVSYFEPRPPATSKLSTSMYEPRPPAIAKLLANGYELNGLTNLKQSVDEYEPRPPTAPKKSTNKHDPSSFCSTRQPTMLHEPKPPANKTFNVSKQTTKRNQNKTKSVTWQIPVEYINRPPTVERPPTGKNKPTVNHVYNLKSPEEPRPKTSRGQKQNNSKLLPSTIYVNKGMKDDLEYSNNERCVNEARAVPSPVLDGIETKYADRWDVPSPPPCGPRPNNKDYEYSAPRENKKNWYYVAPVPSPPPSATVGTRDIPEVDKKILQSDKLTPKNYTMRAVLHPSEPSASPIPTKRIHGNYTDARGETYVLPPPSQLNQAIPFINGNFNTFIPQPPGGSPSLKRALGGQLADDEYAGKSNIKASKIVENRADTVAPKRMHPFDELVQEHVNQPPLSSLNRNQQGLFGDNIITMEVVNVDNDSESEWTGASQNYNYMHIKKFDLNLAQHLQEIQERQMELLQEGKLGPNEGETFTIRLENVEEPELEMPKKKKKKINMKKKNKTKQSAQRNEDIGSSRMQ